VGSFDGGYGIGLLARQIGEKRAKEVWFLCRQYDAETALSWGLVNAVVPLDTLEETTVSWAGELLEKSPLALRLLKSGYIGGLDTHEHVGPLRLTQSGAARPRAVVGAALLSIAVAGFAGLTLAIAARPVLVLVVGGLGIIAALLYSGGPRPYAGLGLGEVMV